MPRGERRCSRGVRILNEVYFACRQCKDYIDAGYRWAVTVLFPGQWDRFPLTIDVDAVLAHHAYWSGESEHPSLAATLPAARRFIEAHREHALVFGDSESFMSIDGDNYDELEWLDVGSLTQPVLTMCFEPRYFVQHPALRYRAWSQVEEYCRLHPCGWRGDPAQTAAAQAVFLRAVAAQADG